MKHMQMPTQAHPCEVKFCALDLKEVTIDGDFEGYASLFNREDLGRDIILPGAFRSSLKKRDASQVKMLFQHDPAQPIGIWKTIHEDARGLFAKGRIMTELAKGREVLTMMRTGAIDGLSIGFRVIEGMRDRRSKVRRIKTVDLWEISIVTFPMLPDARVSSVKADFLTRQRVSQRHHSDLPTQDIGLQRSQAHFAINGGSSNNLQQQSHIHSETSLERQVVEQISEAARLLRKSQFLERTKR